MHFRNAPGQSNDALGVWIDNRDGTGFHKVTERLGNEAPHWPDSYNWNGQFNWILQQPASAYGSAKQQWIYIDDIVLAISEADLPVYNTNPNPDTTSPSAPTALQVQ